MSKQEKYIYEWARAALVADAIIITRDNKETTNNNTPRILLIKRKNAPWINQWALPGGFVNENEPLVDAAARELCEETSVPPSAVTHLLKQVGTWGNPGRDPRGWVVGVAYACLVPSVDLGVKAGDDAAAAEWFEIDNLPLPLACDHLEMIKAALQMLAKDSPLGDEVLCNKLLEAASKL